MKLDVVIVMFKKVSPLLIAATVAFVLYAAVVTADFKSNEFGVEYETLGYQYDFINKLVLNNVPFYIDNEGVVKINNKYSKIAKRLMEELEKRPSTKVADRKYASAIVLLFNKNSIDYTVREDSKTGEIHLIWSKEDDKAARQIVGKEFMQVIKDSYNTGRLGNYLIDKE